MFRIPNQHDIPRGLCPKFGTCEVVNCNFIHSQTSPSLPSSSFSTIPPPKAAEHEETHKSRARRFSEADIASENEVQVQKRMKLSENGSCTSAVPPSTGTGAIKMAATHTNTGNSCKAVPSSLDAEKTTFSAGAGSLEYKRLPPPNPKPVPLNFPINRSSSVFKVAKKAFIPKAVNTHPAPLTTRLLYLKELRKVFEGLKSSLKHLKSETPSQVSEVLDLAAIEEEARIATHQSKTYKNSFAQSLQKFKKMTPKALADFYEGVRALGITIARSNDSNASRSTSPSSLLGTESSSESSPRTSIIFAKPKLITPLQSSLSLEIALSDKVLMKIIQKFLTVPEFFDNCNMVTEIPAQLSTGELSEPALKEKCCRCEFSFDISETSEPKKCSFHYGKKRAGTMTCCNQSIGSPGCTTHHSHVYSHSDQPSKLHQVFPFEKTPIRNEDSSVDPAVAYSFDCEMGYTTKGFELLRVSAIEWPSNIRRLDILVQPFGKVVDANTRFSGITEEQIDNAPLLPDSWPDLISPEALASEYPLISGAGTLYKAASPKVARDVFFSVVDAETPLIAHGIENDLRALRVIHPLLIDTSALFHPRSKFRPSLKNLAMQHLQRGIQTQGANGHDSAEDALATGDLVKFRAQQVWESMRTLGWRLNHDGFAIDNDHPNISAAINGADTPLSLCQIPKKHWWATAHRLAELREERKQIERQETKA